MFDFEKKFMKRFLMRVVIFMVVVAALVSGCSYLNKKAGLKDDNFIEESAEKLIEYKTGLDIDLTPFSEE